MQAQARHGCNLANNIDKNLFSIWMGNLDFFRRESADSRTGYIFLSADAEVQTFC